MDVIPSICFCIAVLTCTHWSRYLCVINFNLLDVISPVRANYRGQLVMMKAEQIPQLQQLSVQKASEWRHRWFSVAPDVCIWMENVDNHSFRTLAEWPDNGITTDITLIYHTVDHWGVNAMYRVVWTRSFCYSCLKYCPIFKFFHSDKFSVRWY